MSTHTPFDDFLRGIIENIVEHSVQKALLCKSQSVTNEKPEILTIQQAAEFLNLAVQTLYGMTSRKEIPFFKRSKRLYFKHSELLKWIENGRRKTRSEINADAALLIAKSKRGGR